jgi:hypothetical protein
VEQQQEVPVAVAVRRLAQPASQPLALVAEEQRQAELAPME